MLVVLSAGGCGILSSAIEVGATAERFHFAIACRAGIIRYCSQFPRNPIRQVRDSEKVVHLRRVKVAERAGGNEGESQREDKHSLYDSSA